MRDNGRHDPPDLKAARRYKATTALLERKPPSSPEAERGVLGCVLLDPETVLDDLQAQGLREEEFYELRHREVWKAAVALREGRQPVDVLTLQQRLKDSGLLESIGPAYVSSLPDDVPSSANWSYYAGIVREKALLRELIRVCTETVGQIYDSELDVPAILDKAERDVLAVRARNRKHAAHDIKAIVSAAIDQMEQARNSQGQLSGISTGLRDVDAMTDGMHAGELWVIGGFTSTGKTSLAMNIAEHAGIVCGVPVGVFSLEMSAASLVVRFLASMAKVNVRALSSCTEDDVRRLTIAAGKLVKGTVQFDDASDLHIAELRARARRLQQQHGTRIFVVDYLQLVTGVREKNGTREQEISSISKGLKALAKELNATVLALSQLNDDGATRESKAPAMDADLVAVLKSEEEHDSDEVAPVRMVIKKQRNGNRGVVPLTFFRKWTRFENASPVDPDDVPKTKTNKPKKSTCPACPD